MMLRGVVVMAASLIGRWRWLRASSVFWVRAGIYPTCQPVTEINMGPAFAGTTTGLPRSLYGMRIASRRARSTAHHPRQFGGNPELVIPAKAGIHLLWQRIRRSG